MPGLLPLGTVVAVLCAAATPQPSEPAPAAVSAALVEEGLLAQPTAPFSRSSALTATLAPLVLGGALLISMPLAYRLDKVGSPGFNLFVAGGVLAVFGPGAHYLFTEEPLAFLFSGLGKAALVGASVGLTALTVSMYGSIVPFVTFFGGALSLLGWFVFDVVLAHKSPVTWQRREREARAALEPGP